MKPSELKMWAVRSTLMRIKRRERVVKLTRSRLLYTEYIRKQSGATGGTLLKAEDPPELPFDCDDPECDVCFPQFFPAIYSVTDTEATATITGLVDRISKDTKYLRDMLGSHADLIATRWMNKTRTRRYKFLVDNTDIYKTKWAPLHLLQAQMGPDEKWEKKVRDIIQSSTPDVPPALGRALSTMFYKTVRDLSTGVDHFITWVLPYLDAETLAEDPLRFLALLHYRTVNEPAAWIMFDNAQLALSEHLSILPGEFNKHCVVMQGKDFGSLVPWNATQAHRWEIVGYNKAQCLLTAQQLMMAFLRQVVESVCREATEMLPRSVHPKWEAMVSTKFTTPAAHWATPSVRPFSEPPSFDPYKVLDMVTTHYRAVKDEVQLLQTDPAYVHFMLSQLSSTVFIEKIPHEGRSDYYVDEVMMVPLRREMYWRQLFKECTAMVKAFEASKDGSAGSCEQFDVMLFVVMDMAMEFFAFMGSLLDYSLPLQPGMERNYEYVDGLDSAGNYTRKLRVISRDWFPEDMLFWSLDCLGADMHRSFALDPGFNFHVMDDMISNTKDKARINQHLYDHVTEMAAINEVIAATRSQKLRNREPSEDLLRKVVSENFRKDFISKIGKFSVASLSDELRNSMKTFLSAQWPSGKRDASWLDRAGRCRKSLAQYWQKVRVLWAKRLRELGVKQETVDEDIALLSADLTPEYEMEKAQEIEVVQQRINAEKAARRAKSGSDQDLPDYLSGMHVSPGKENVALKTQLPRLKHKTRPEEVPATTDAKAIIDNCEPSSEEDIPTISVKRENLAVFRNMYPASGDEGRRSFKWQHFLDAMVDAGFFITQASGSAVSFRLTSQQDDFQCLDAGSIAFHRPHPDPVIDPVMLRAMGKRLRKWFGWSRDIFEQRQ